MALAYFDALLTRLEAVLVSIATRELKLATVFRVDVVEPLEHFLRTISWHHGLIAYLVVY